MPESAASTLRRIGPLTVRFSSDDEAVLNRLDDLYAAFPAAARTGEGGAGEGPVAVEIVGDGDTNEWQAIVDGATVARSRHLGLVEEAATRRINRLLLDAETDRLHLHAGAVARGGETVLVVGTSGSGKSTLVAWLVAAGWAYLSDEQLGVLEGARLVPYPRPLTLRRRSWELVPGAVADELDDAIERVEIAPRSLGPVFEGQPPTPAVIVVPDVAQPEHGVEQLPAAAAVAALFQDTLDLERAGSAGFDRLLELATSAPMLRIAGTSLAESAAAISSALEGSFLVPSLVSTTEPHAQSVVAPLARAWTFSDATTVVYDPASGALAQFDEQGAAAWRMLATSPASELPAEAAASGFVDELRTVGLLGDDAARVDGADENAT